MISIQYYMCLTDFGKRKSYAQIYDLTIYPMEPLHCDVCGLKGKIFDYDFNTESKLVLTNDNFPDFYMLDPPYLYCSEKARSILLDSGYDYLEFLLVEILKKESLTEKQLREVGNRKKIPDDVPPYYRVRVPKQGWPHEDQLRKYNYCENCHHYRAITTIDTYEPIIDLKTIGFYDLFQFENWGSYLLCSQNFVDLCKVNSLTGFDFKTVECR